MKKLPSIILTINILTACATTHPQNEMVGVANPASEFCLKQGGKLEPKKDKDGNEYTLCHLPNGQVVEEWDYLHSFSEQAIYSNTHSNINPNTLIVFYDNHKKDEVLALFKTLNTKVLYDYKTMNGFAIEIDPNQRHSIKQTLQNHPSIFGVNDDAIVHLD